MKNVLNHTISFGIFEKKEEKKVNIQTSIMCVCID